MHDRPRLSIGDRRPDTHVEVMYDDRWIGPHGIGRFAAEIFSRIPGLRAVPHTLPKLHPLEPLWLSAVVARSGAHAYLTPGFNPPLIANIPFIMTVHDLNYLVVPDNSSVMRRMYYRTIVRSGCRRAARVLTVSEFSRGQIGEWTGLPDERIVKVYNGVSTVFQPHGPVYERDFRYFLYVGLRGAHKNLPRMIQAFARARISSDIRLVLTGAPDAGLRALAAAEGCDSRLEFLGSVSDEDLARAYRGAIALLMPSPYEGFGLPALEAIACGTPTMASRVGGLEEICGEAALFVEPERVDSLISGLERIADDPQLRSTLRERGILQSGKFTWERTVGLVSTALDEVLAG